MNNTIDALVGYLAGDEGPEADLTRADMANSSSEASRLFESALRWSQEALGEDVLRLVSFFAGGPLGEARKQGERGKGNERQEEGRTSSAASLALPPRRGWLALGRALPWSVALLSCVLVGLLYQEVREQRHRLDVTLTLLDQCQASSQPQSGRPGADFGRRGTQPQTTRIDIDRRPGEAVKAGQPPPSAAPDLAALKVGRVAATTPPRAGPPLPETGAGLGRRTTAPKGPAPRPPGAAEDGKASKISLPVRGGRAPRAGPRNR